MRILQITAFSGWGCTGRIAVGIHEILIEKNNESAIAWGRINTAPQSIKTIKIGNHFDQQLHGLYTRISDKCGFGSKKTTQDFIMEIERYNPDLIQLHIMHGYYINLEILFDYIKNKNIPVVWTFHDCWAFTGHCPYFDLAQCVKWKEGCYECPQKKHHPSSWFLDNSKWNWDKKNEIYGNYEKLTIVTPSKWMADLVKQSFLKDREVYIINNGININDFKPSCSKIKDKLGVSNKHMVLGVSSSWAKSKGLDDFIALSRLLSDDYKIVLVGLSKKQIENLPSKIIGIEKTDSLRELAEIYTAASVFVNPTYEDNYPTTNLEALACGTPVVGYNAGGTGEIITASNYGSVVQTGDIYGLTEKIVFNANREKETVDLSLLNSSECFKKYYSLYEKILSQKGNA